MKKDSRQNSGGQLVAIFSRVLALAILVGALLQATARAADMYWVGGPYEDFGVPSNWRDGVVPGAADNAYWTNNAASMVKFESGDRVCANAVFNNGPDMFHLGLYYDFSWTVANSFVIGQDAGSTGFVYDTAGGAGRLLVTNSAGTGALVIGQAGTGTLWLRGGTVVADQLFATNGASSVFTFASGTLNTLHGATIGGDFVIGSTPDTTIAIWNMTGGTNVTGAAYTSIGDINGSASKGAVTVSGTSTVWTNRGILYMGLYTGNNRLVVTNGGHVYTTGSANLGIYGAPVHPAYTSTNNTVLLTGSSSLWCVDSDLNIGNFGGANTITIQDDGELRAGNVCIGVSSFGNRLTMSGGRLTVTNSGGAALLNVRGGTLALSGGTATVDTLYATNGVNSIVAFDGGTLATKSTVVSNDAVFTVGNGTDAAMLDLRGGTHSFAGGLTLAANATLAIGGTNAIGAAVITGNVTLQEGAAFDCDFNATTNDRVQVNGTVALPALATVTLRALEPSPRRQIPMLQASAITGDVSGWPLTRANQTVYQAVVVGNQLILRPAPMGTTIMMK